MTRIILKRGEEERLLHGHPWVFDNEIDHHIGELQSGGIADVETSTKKYVGRAFVNPASKIVARIYSPSKEGVDEGFFRRRIRNAVNARLRYNLNTDCARLVFAEADFLPGLIIDQYIGWDYESVQNMQKNGNTELSFETLVEGLGMPSKWLCMQFLTYAMDMRKEIIISALEYVLENSGDGDVSQTAIKGIIEKSAAPVREREGLLLFEGVIKGSVPDGGIVIFENGAPFFADLVGGQKTGTFLDQSENHALCALYAKSLSCVHGQTERPVKVLDAFCYSGGFTINILRTVNAEVYAADSSGAAIGALKKNADLNGVLLLEAALFAA